MGALVPKQKVAKAPPELSDKAIEKARRKVLVRRGVLGIASTNPTGGQGVTQSILGSAAGLTGSIV